MQYPFLKGDVSPSGSYFDAIAKSSFAFLWDDLCQQFSSLYPSGTRKREPRSERQNYRKNQEEIAFYEYKNSSFLKFRHCHENQPYSTKRRFTRRELDYEISEKVDFSINFSAVVVKRTCTLHNANAFDAYKRLSSQDVEIH